MKRQPELPEIPAKPKRRMRQPTKDTLRQRLAQQTDELERLRIDRDRLAAEVESLRTPAWRRLLRKRA